MSRYEDGRLIVPTPYGVGIGLGLITSCRQEAPGPVCLEIAVHQEPPPTGTHFGRGLDRLVALAQHQGMHLADLAPWSLLIQPGLVAVARLIACQKCGDKTSVWWRWWFDEARLAGKEAA
ncbi:MAG: hypothetical protein KQJ78_24025 [Deltaproteobacteria bacterium]|nr:hypothetical protein [Deltaproteobacteria bacterium]